MTIDLRMRLAATVIGVTLVLGCALRGTYRVAFREPATDPTPIGRLVLVGDAGLSIGEVAPDLSPRAPIDACKPKGPQAEGAEAAEVALAEARRQVPILTHIEQALRDVQPNAIAWLGDNVYQRGIEAGLKVATFWEPNGKLRPQAKAHAEYPSFVALHVQVSASRLADHALFVPGNHDWDSRIKASADGDERIAAQRAAIHELACRVNAPDPTAIDLLPGDGCPGPRIVDLDFGAQSVRVVAIDSESLLQTIKRGAAKKGCLDEDGFFARLTEDVRTSPAPLVVIAHHPMTTYGPHGGFNGYGPIGLLKSLFRKLYGHDQDLSGGNNERMVKRLRHALKQAGQRVLAYASGHEHSLQLIRRGSDSYWEIGAGAGSKTSPVREGPGSQYARSTNGFVYIDFYADGNHQLNVLAVEADGRVSRRQTTLAAPSPSRPGAAPATVEQLSAIWRRAQATGGVFAIEPRSHATVPAGATKKTWKVADEFLKIFWGREPIWYPADVMRRSACAPAATWTYFWHDASGDERDLHPWLPGGIDHILGKDLASALEDSKALDVSRCTDVGGADTACLYGEVTPPKSFDDWFCGGTSEKCYTRLLGGSTRVNPAFGPGRTVCVMGPWLQERVHAGRPEIHPSEVMWSRAGDALDWRFAIVPDASSRFDQDRHFRALKGEASVPQAWSQDREVELWVAFSQDAKAPLEFDFARQCMQRRQWFRKPKPKYSKLSPIRVPAPSADFIEVATGLPDLSLSIRTWDTASKRQGLLVLRSRTRPVGCEATVMGLLGRHAGNPAPPPLTAVDDEDGKDSARGPGAAAEALPAIRVRALDEVVARPASGGRAVYAITTRAGFTASEATRDHDTGPAAKLNKALRRGSKHRVAAFGEGRPFKITWMITAMDSEGQRVPVRQGPPPFDPDVGFVTVWPSRTGLTQAIEIVGAEAGPETAAEPKPEEGLERVGDLLISAPVGVRVRGRGRVTFVGTRPNLAHVTAGLGFAIPVPTRPWELVREVLDEIDSNLGEERLAGLRRAACEPLAPDCSLTVLADLISQKALQPAAGIEDLLGLEQPTRTFARLVWLLAAAYVENGNVDTDELMSLRSLLDGVQGRWSDFGAASRDRIGDGGEPR